jgi:putative acetyltransferase
MGIKSGKARDLREALRSLILAHGTLEGAKRPCGAPLSLPHAYALLELLQSKEPMTVSELAARLAIDRTNVSRLCARMENAGELTREAHPVDGRAVVLTLSAQGRKLAVNVDKSSTSHFRRLAESLGDQTEGVIESLEILAKAMAPTEEEE